MICKSWRETQDTSEINDIYRDFDLLIIGENVYLDDRTKLLKDQFNVNGKRIVSFYTKYNHFNFDDNSEVTLFIDEQEFSLKDKYEEYLNLFNEHKILIDMTTIDVPSLAHLLDFIDSRIKKFSICYIEPVNYSKLIGSTSNINQSYQLSEDGNGLDYITPFMLSPLDKIEKYLISIGYESNRLAGFLSSTEEVKAEVEKNIMIGIPAFNAGWENRSIDANYRFLKDTEIHIVPADDPIQTYLNLVKLGKSANITSTNNKLIVVPIGTKPHSLGMIWFALENKGKVGMIYDFVTKIPKRTEGVKKIHFWNFIQTN